MSTTDQQQRSRLPHRISQHLPHRDEVKAFAAEVRRESRVQVPLELDPRSPLYDKHEMRSAFIAVGAVGAVMLLGLVVGIVALFA